MNQLGAQNDQAITDDHQALEKSDAPQLRASAQERLKALGAGER